MVIVLHVTDFMRFYDLASHIIPQILLGVIPDHRPGASLSMTKRQIRKDWSSDASGKAFTLHVT